MPFEGHGRHCGLPDASLDPARQRPPRRRPRELRPVPADHDHRARGLRSPTRASRRRRSHASAPATSSPTRSCVRWRHVVPDSVSAGVGNLKVVAYSGLLPSGQHWVYMDIQEGSYGGRPGKDGLDAVDTLYANTRNNPIEDIESHYPLRVTRYELNVDTGGAWTLARRARLDPRDRVPRTTAASRSRATVRSIRRPGCSAAATEHRGRSRSTPGRERPGSAVEVPVPGRAGR